MPGSSPKEYSIAPAHREDMRRPSRTGREPPGANPRFSFALIQKTELLEQSDDSAALGIDLQGANQKTELLCQGEFNRIRGRRDGSPTDRAAKRKSKEQARMPIRRPLAKAAAILLLVVASTGCDKIKSRMEVKKGNEFFKAGQYQAALASYQVALQLDPNQKKLYKNIGMTYMAMYQPGSKHPKDLEYASKAIENLKIYIAAYPDDKRAREFLVSMYLSTDKYDEAIAFYQDRLQADPKDTKAMQSMATMYFKKGDWDKGVEWLQKRAAMEPNNPEGYLMIGIQAWDRSYHYPDIDPAQRAKIIDTGIQATEKALQLKPEYFDALTYINLLYREKAKVETDPAKQQEDIATADKYREQALEIRKKTMPTPTPEPGK